MHTLCIQLVRNVVEKKCFVCNITEDNTAPDVFRIRILLNPPRGTGYRQDCLVLNVQTEAKQKCSTTYM